MPRLLPARTPPFGRRGRRRRCWAWRWSLRYPARPGGGIAPTPPLGAFRASRQKRARKAPQQHTTPDRIRLRRRLPNFPRTFDDNAFPMWTVDEQVRPILALIRKNRRVQSLDRRLRNHPGYKSRISLEALFLAAILAANILGSYRRTDLCAVLNGLLSQIAYQLGL